MWNREATMKTRVIYSLLAIGLVLPSMAFAANVSGEISVGGIGVSGDNTDSAQFNEYRNELESGIFGSAKVSSFNGPYYLDLSADGGHLEATVGRFGTGRLSVFFDKMYHNFKYEGRTIYGNADSDAEQLLYGSGVVVTNPATWIEFDNDVTLKRSGAAMDLKLGSSGFASFGVTKAEKEGTQPFGAAAGSSPGNGFVELPLPIDYDTTTFNGKLGYATETFSVSLDGTVSKFENGNEVVEWQNPFTAGTFKDVTEAPDNDLWQVGGQFALTQLPLNSTLALRGSLTHIESDVDLLNGDQFDGEIEYTTASAILRSRPVKPVDVELSYRYVDKDNDSDSMDFGGGSETELFHYTKHNAAIQANWRVTAGNRLSAGYDFLTIDRAEEVRFDAESTDDNKFFVEWKNSSLDMLTAKLRYQYLDRDSDFNGEDAVTSVDSQIYRYIRPYDAANKEQDQYEVGFEFSPFSHVDLGLEYSYTTSDYDESDLGRTDDTAQELIVDANVHLPYDMKLYGYASYEKVESTLDSRRYNNNGAPNPYGPTQDGNNYNWEAERQDDGWAYGVKFEAPLLDKKLLLTAAFDYEKSEGEVEYSSNVTSVNNAFVDISEYDDFTRKTLDLKAEYTVSENVVVTAGYVYDKYEYSDAQMDDYLYFASGNCYLSGAYSDPDYDAKYGYLKLTYKF